MISLLKAVLKTPGVEPDQCFLRFFLMKEYEEQQVKEDQSEIAKAFEIDFAKCKEENDKWNASIQPIREARTAAEKKASEELVLQRMTEHEKRIKDRQEEANRIIKLTKEQAKTFITSENINAAIDEALENVVSFNYAIDLQGNILKNTDEDIKKQENVQKQ